MSIEHNLSNGNDDNLPGEEKFDDTAFEIFFKSHFTILCAFCQYKFGFDLDQSKEVVHTAFIKLWETRNQISSASAVKSYIYRIITNSCLDILKHEKVKVRYERAILYDTSSGVSTGDFHSADVKEMAADIERAVAELPEQMRKIFELSRYEGLKYLAIADHLGISVKTVETQMSRALIKLRQRLSRYLVSVLILLALYLG